MRMDLLFLIIATGFILSKLFRILGKNDHDVRNSGDKIDPIIAELYKNQSSSNTQPAVDIEIASESEAALSQDIRDVFDQIRKIDPAFNLDKFYHGAKKAFGAILSAFVSGDKATLKHLLDKEVFNKFSGAITRRQENKQTMIKTVVGINSITVTEASLIGDKVTISVEISSDQINTTKDELGNVLHGHLTAIVTLSDSWTFTRDLSKDNTWLLVETGPATH